jgi:hypothetical protein
VEVTLPQGGGEVDVDNESGSETSGVIDHGD